MISGFKFTLFHIGYLHRYKALEKYEYKIIFVWKTLDCQKLKYQDKIHAPL